MVQGDKCSVLDVVGSAVVLVNIIRAAVGEVNVRRGIEAQFEVFEDTTQILRGSGVIVGPGTAKRSDGFNARRITIVGLWR